LGKERQEYPLITEDLVFDHVMGKKENYMELLRRAYPELDSKDTEVLTQYDGKTAYKAEHIRLDVWARDDQGRVFDFEMQRKNDGDLEQRMQYYIGNLIRYTLQSEQNYSELKNVYVVFLCTFDSYYRNESCYDFKMFDEKTRSIEIKVGLHVKILNSKGIRDSDAPVNDVLDYMEGDSNQTDDYVKKLQKDLENYIGSGKWVQDMDKYDYELKKAAEKATENNTEKNARSFIEFNKN
jgi:hypothetical protein